MNSRPILKALHAHLNNCEHWLTDKFYYERALMGMEKVVIDFARQLTVAREERLEKLKLDGPRVYYTEGELNVVLLRDGKEEHHNFAECYVSVVKTNTDKVCEEFKLTDPPDEDGYTYFIRATRTEVSKEREYGIQVSKKEAIIIRDAMKAELEDY
jgi:hypothetical protein